MRVDQGAKRGLKESVVAEECGEELGPQGLNSVSALAGFMTLDGSTCRFLPLVLKDKV